MKTRQGAFRLILLSLLSLLLSAGLLQAAGMMGDRMMGGIPAPYQGVTNPLPASNSYLLIKGSRNNNSLFWNADPCRTGRSNAV